LIERTEVDVLLKLVSLKGIYALTQLNIHGNSLRTV